MFQRLRPRKRLLIVATLMTIGATMTHADMPAFFADGTIITLKSDSGNFAARCLGCLPGQTLPNNIAVHISDPASPFIRFRVAIWNRLKHSAGFCWQARCRTESNFHRLRM